MHVLDIIIETPRGHTEKFNFDPSSGRFKLKKILPAGMVFPYDFGFIPNSKGQDGDPLDALIFSEITSFPGCVVECRLLGALICEQKQNGNSIRNDRFLFVPIHSQQFSDVKTITDINPIVLKEIEAFFTQYNQLEGKEFRVMERLNDEAAFQCIKDSYR